jgi:hypothetical protein
MESRTPCNNSADHGFGTTPLHSTVCKCVHILLWSLLSSAVLMCSCLLSCRQRMNFEHWVHWGWMKDIFLSIITCIISSTLIDSARLTLWSMKSLYTISNNSVPIKQCIAITKTTMTMLLMRARACTQTYTHTRCKQMLIIMYMVHIQFFSWY